MLYGEEKALEMSRSLLPSSGRKSARRAKARLNRRLRRAAKQRLHTIHEEDDYYESNLDFDYRDDGQHERYWIVGDRRGADKVNHFIRWAKARAAHIPNGEKYYYIKSLLPGSGFIIVDHAMGHLEYTEGFERNIYEFGWRYRYRQPRPKISKEQIKEYLREIIIDNRAHKLLNNFIKRSHNSVVWDYKVKVWDKYHDDGFYFETRSVKKGKGPRVLKGLHDIDHFIDDIKRAFKAPSYIKKPKPEFVGITGSRYTYNKQYWSSRIKNPNHHPEWKVAATRFINAWLEDRDDYGKLHQLLLSSNDRQNGIYHGDRHLWSW
jgi:hypothetical protein